MEYTFAKNLTENIINMIEGLINSGAVGVTHQLIFNHVGEVTGVRIIPGSKVFPS